MLVVVNQLPICGIKFGLKFGLKFGHPPWAPQLNGLMPDGGALVPEADQDGLDEVTQLRREFAQREVELHSDLQATRKTVDHLREEVQRKE